MNREDVNTAMMPLTLVNAGKEHVIRRIGGLPEVKKHLEDLGFVVGGTVTVVSTLNGNVIVGVKETRLASAQALAPKIMV